MLHHLLDRAAHRWPDRIAVPPGESSESLTASISMLGRPRFISPSRAWVIAVRDAYASRWPRPPQPHIRPLAWITM